MNRRLVQAAVLLAGASLLGCHGGDGPGVGSNYPDDGPRGYYGNDAIVAGDREHGHDHDPGGHDHGGQGGHTVGSGGGRSYGNGAGGMTAGEGHASGGGHADGGGASASGSGGGGHGGGGGGASGGGGSGAGSGGGGGGGGK